MRLSTHHEGFANGNIKKVGTEIIVGYEHWCEPHDWDTDLLVNIALDRHSLQVSAIIAPADARIGEISPILSVARLIAGVDGLVIENVAKNNYATRRISNVKTDMFLLQIR